MEKKQTRVDSYRSDGAYRSFYHDLIAAAVVLLQHALDDRAHYSRREKNHLTKHGPGAIVLIVTAFDVWLSEVACALSLDDSETRKMLEKNTVEKYRAIYRRLHGSLPNTDDLSCIVSVRDEIVHHFPSPNTRTQPQWLKRLLSANLVFASNDPPLPDTITLTMKLSCYRLAYWVFETLARLNAELIADAAKRHPRLWNYSGPGNLFGWYRTVRPGANIVQTL